ncbi:MAG: VOC family protein [Bacteroidota bacterium]
MLPLILHHYGFLTADTAAWLEENELLLGKPFKVFDTVHVSSQKVKITFVQQAENTVLTELIEPLDDNLHLTKMISKGITIYHTGYIVTKEDFDKVVNSFEEKGAHSLPIFNSEAFEKKRCVFLITRSLGMIEIIEQ